jgi:hypothetical protein
VFGLLLMKVPISAAEYPNGIEEANLPALLKILDEDQCHQVGDARQLRSESGVIVRHENLVCP